MKKILLIIIILITQISCSEKGKTTYIGNINNKVNGEIEIYETGNDVNGTFYNLDTKIRIKLKGTKVNNVLTLQEYAKDNVISGFFEGTVIENEYKGNWYNPKKTISTPFSFKLKQNKTVSKEAIIDKPVSAKLNDVKLQEGIEKRNIFLYKLLDEINLSLKKEKKKLVNIENDNYYSQVVKEKKILKTKKTIKGLKNTLYKIRHQISNKQLGKYFPFQKTPEGVVNHFFLAFKKLDFSKFEYLIDPYGEYSNDLEMLTLFQIFSDYKKIENLMNDFKVIKFKIINTRIDKNTAYVLTKTEKEYNNDETLFTLINRNSIWYLTDISN